MNQVEMCKHYDPLHMYRCHQGLKGNLQCHSKRQDCQFYEPSTVEPKPMRVTDNTQCNKIASDFLSRHSAEPDEDKDWEEGSRETRESLVEGHGRTFPNAQEAVEWLKEPDRLLTLEEITDKTSHHDTSESLLIVRNLQDGKTAAIKNTEIEKYRDRIAVLVEQVVRVEAECQARVEKGLISWLYEHSDVDLAKVFDTSYGYQDVRLEVFMHESDSVWKALKRQERRNEN